MPESKPHPILEFILTSWIVIRVGLIIVVWLGIFLALFLGYFTVPIILVIAFSLIYALSDATFLVANQMRKKADSGRGDILKNRSHPNDEEPAP